MFVLATCMIFLVLLLKSTFNFTKKLVITGQEASLKIYANTGKMQVPIMSRDPSHLETLQPLQRLKRRWNASSLVIPAACEIIKMRTSTFNIARWVHICLLKLIPWCEGLDTWLISCSLARASSIPGSQCSPENDFYILRIWPVLMSQLVTGWFPHQI